MRDKSLDEFESIFERASIPVLDIRELSLTRIAVVLKGGPLDDAVITLALYLKKRFNAEAHVLWAADLQAQQVHKAALDRELLAAEHPFTSAAELVGQVSIGRSALVLLPDQPGEETGGIQLDALVRGTSSPILVVRKPPAPPAQVFGKILHSLTGNFQQTQNFAYSFTLVEDSGAISLLHTIDEGEIHDVREVLQVAPDIAADSREELLKALAHQGERYLKAVVAASRDLPYDVSYRLAIGDVVSTVQQTLRDETFGLLVVGRHSEGYSYVESADYQLMHAVHDIPVLAL